MSPPPSRGRGWDFIRCWCCSLSNSSSLGTLLPLSPLVPGCGRPPTHLHLWDLISVPGLGAQSASVHCGYGNNAIIAMEFMKSPHNLVPTSSLRLEDLGQSLFGRYSQDPVLALFSGPLLPLLLRRCCVQRCRNAVPEAGGRRSEGAGNGPRARGWLSLPVQALPLSTGVLISLMADPALVSDPHHAA